MHHIKVWNARHFRPCAALRSAHVRCLQSLKARAQIDLTLEDKTSRLISEQRKQYSSSTSRPSLSLMETKCFMFEKASLPIAATVRGHVYVRPGLPPEIFVMLLFVCTSAVMTVGDLSAVIQIPLISSVYQRICLVSYLQETRIKSAHVYTPRSHLRGLPALGELVVIEWKYSSASESVNE